MKKEEKTYATVVIILRTEPNREEIIGSRSGVWCGVGVGGGGGVVLYF